MLLSTMTDNEILNEIKKDFNYSFEKGFYYRNKFLKKIKKRYKAETALHTWETPRHNIWYSLCTFDGYQMKHRFFVLLKNKNGSHKMVAPSIENEKIVDGITIFSNHFFDRYRQRYLGNINYTFSEVFEKFISKNTDYLSSCTDDGLYTIFNEGIGLTTKGENNVYYVNTFIARDMLSNNQHKVLYGEEKLFDLLTK